MSRFFIERPIFSAVIAIVILIAGAVSIKGLPVAQYPEITPPTVQVTASYPGANAQVVSATVAQPIEEEVNGVENMIYMSSVCAADGSYTLTVSFEIGTDLDMATVLVQNRVSIAMASLPEEVTRLGVTTKKQSTNIVMLLSLDSEDNRYDELFLSNFVTMRLKDDLARLPGVGDVQIFGVGDYSMRIWLDPSKMEAHSITTTDVIHAIQEQNVQVAAGKIGEPPAPEGQQFEYTVNVKGRLADAKEFGNIIIKADPSGRFLRVKDVAKVELGAQTYNVFGLRNNKPSAILAIYQIPGANAIDVQKRVIAKMEELKGNFPPGLQYGVPLDTTKFISASIKEVITTLIIAILLVVFTLFIFLQDWRSTIIPAVTIPVSLIGTFLMMKLMGFSINLISLFGLVLAIGIVVDDAIVVVENTDRLMVEEGMEPRPAAIKAMEEIGGAVVATTLVLLAVFVPTAFMGGITGQLYRQFALTISGATVISSINALTLSPALCALLLRKEKGKPNIFFRGFNWAFEHTTNGYMALVRGFLRKSLISLLIAAAIAVVSVKWFGQLPSSFLPLEDQGYTFISAQLPDAASLQRTEQIARDITKLVEKIPGVKDCVAVPGYSLLENAMLSNFASFFVSFKPFEERLPKGHNLDFIMASIRKNLSDIRGAQVIAFAPPAIPGLGTSAGFKMMVQDKTGMGPFVLQKATEVLAEKANTQSSLRGVYSTFRATIPQLFVDIDRNAVKMMGIPLSEVFGTLQAYLGSSYVNDFTKFGRNFQVKVQAESDARARVDDIKKLRVRNAEGKMIPLGTFVNTHFSLGPQVLTRYNLYPAAAVNGEAAPGFSSGQALQVMEDLADKNLPGGMGYAWTEMSYQEKKASKGAGIIFLLAIVFVFLVLSAQYESWSVPLGVIMVVPLSLLGVVLAVVLRGMSVSTYTQIGVVLLVALAAKNAILIVEFAKDAHEKEGKSIFDAAAEAAKLRFRPILMTSLSFVLGTAPLVVATGAGAGSRQALGTAVFGGQIAAIVMAVIFVPVFYKVVQSASEWFKKPKGKKKEVSSPTPEA